MSASPLLWPGRITLLLFLGAGAVLHCIGHDRAISILDSLPPVCPLRIWLGIQCSFCGMTHSFVHLFFGEWQEALRHNLLSIPLFLAIPTGSTLAAAGRIPHIARTQAQRLAWAGLSILFLYTLARLPNCPL